MQQNVPHDKLSKILTWVVIVGFSLSTLGGIFSPDEPLRAIFISGSIIFALGVIWILRAETVAFLKKYAWLAAWFAAISTTDNFWAFRTAEKERTAMIDAINSNFY